ncbi:hypothetical protein AAGS61_03090 [Lysinibacillus sp. KU-BSD001]|uniref:hypothetical protein n=1 Tax=Lysinibacillus sp. KU-BSD001 TaxID=3141328 RepID=UPI0036E5AF9E
MIKVKVLFVDDSGLKDREEVFSTTDKKEAALMTVEKMTIKEIKYLLSFEFMKTNNEQEDYCKICGTCLTVDDDHKFLCTECEAI